MASGELLPKTFKFETTDGGPQAAAALVKWLRVQGATANLKTLSPSNNEGLGDEGVDAIAEGLAASGVALEKLELGDDYSRSGCGAGSEAGAALVKWLALEGAEANLKVLDLRFNEGLGAAEKVAINKACPEDVKPTFN